MNNNSGKTLFNLNLHLFDRIIQETFGKNTLFQKLEEECDLSKGTCFYAIKINKRTLEDHFIIIKSHIQDGKYHRLESLPIQSIQFRSMKRANTPAHFKHLPLLEELIISKELKDKLLTISLSQIDEKEKKYIITMIPEIHVKVLRSSTMEKPKSLYSVIFNCESILFQNKIETFLKT